MKYLNLGCGKHYSVAVEWTNVDMVLTNPHVIKHDLSLGIPFEPESFDLVYHSHILEHFDQSGGKKFIAECLRVLKPGGIIRIVVPDLERMVRCYLDLLEEGLLNPDDKLVKANYEWILIEMFDQVGRNHSGGAMAEYLSRKEIINKPFVFFRIGEEDRSLRQALLKTQNKEARNTDGSFFEIWRAFKKRANRVFKSRDNRYGKIGRFRLGPEVHRQMYDRYSLSLLLRESGAVKIILRDAFTSYIPEWRKYELDGRDGEVRKPDSLFLEAIKEA